MGKICLQDIQVPATTGKTYIGGGRSGQGTLKLAGHTEIYGT